MDNLNLFNNKAENYVKARPNYAKRSLKSLKLIISAMKVQLRILVVVQAYLPANC